MDKEQLIINHFNNKFLGDDAAVLGKMVYAKDLFFEDVHFKREWLSLEQIGYKAMIVNFSDIIVMNATPKYALLGLALPKSITNEQITGLYGGIKKACDKYGVSIIGGDTICSDKICISVSVFGVLNAKAVFRKGLKNGDFIAYTGKLGSSLKSLKSLINIGKTSHKSRFFDPILRDRFFYKSAKFINSAMDISDGLTQDLAKLCASAKKGFKFIKKPIKYELESGEEYEILFSFSPKNRAKIEQIAKKTRTKITIFAKATKGRYKTNARSHHF
ncbi:thiamine-phosphate kinase [Campylobacter mucosalis]|uniref:Thiamine-monophosphate kinase n=1 Tax=Campylobacter mucosalis CCUG 21559 TaxID=1032067 RepID=A0A6G5QHR4_9BACT|nr:thiamine-phosphate kinase [Campylobacter mucosalis]QCD45243.1 thiamine monophosphate kinase [Campylobacter mucosalis CCUG 21559]